MAKTKTKRLVSAELLAQNLCISVGEARKLLGVEAKDLTDDELIELIYSLTLLSREVLAYSVRKNQVGSD